MDDNIRRNEGWFCFIPKKIKLTKAISMQCQAGMGIELNKFFNQNFGFNNGFFLF
jgi:hypothetical protein